MLTNSALLVDVTDPISVTDIGFTTDNTDYKFSENEEDTNVTITIFWGVDKSVAVALRIILGENCTGETNGKITYTIVSLKV